MTYKQDVDLDRLLKEIDTLIRYSADNGRAYMDVNMRESVDVPIVNFLRLRDAKRTYDAACGRKPMGHFAGNAIPEPRQVPVTFEIIEADRPE